MTHLLNNFQVAAKLNEVFNVILNELIQVDFQFIVPTIWMIKKLMAQLVLTT